jgi:hypothetical protein
VAWTGRRRYRAEAERGGSFNPSRGALASRRRGAGTVVGSYVKNRDDSGAVISGSTGDTSALTQITPHLECVVGRLGIVGGTAGASAP